MIVSENEMYVGQDASKETPQHSSQSIDERHKALHTNIDNDKEQTISSSVPRTIQITNSFTLADYLTVVVTTSPIRSNPSTELLEKTFDTFHYGGYDFAYRCQKVIICDGCRIIPPDEEEESKDHGDSTSETVLNDNNNGSNDFEGRKIKKRLPTVTKKYVNVKQSLRNGIATSSQADDYCLFKEALKLKCKMAYTTSLDAKNPSPFQNTRVVELEKRHGYSFALKHALEHEVKTPYVCVIQHDRTFIRSAPIAEIVQTMMKNHPSRTKSPISIENSNDVVNDGSTKNKSFVKEPIMQQVKYVGLSMRSNLLYRDHLLSKYGREWYDQMLDMVLMPPELRLPSNTYGVDYCVSKCYDVKDGDSCSRINHQMLQKFPFLRSGVRDNLISIARKYKKSMQHTSQIALMKSYRSSSMINTQSDTIAEEENLHQLSLTPTVFWYDNTHIVETKHYRDFIFHPKKRMVSRGGFVEEQLSPIIVKHVKEGLKEGKGFVEGFSRFGCYLLDDHSGFYFTGHLDGGAYITDEQRKRDVEVNKPNPSIMA
mmetsp:Transcript_19526/g.29383  ORF Transcript_19526/g.29383 Transcript_19526/m.29383 type:complete len:541 (-) Transcript_19526:57-1679(-)|eukprot:CAMPEP_0178910332 /NCGR_PEP_ID=MMETSP0786-20121207/9039_1 /TAXON_ID=186022 /ORGANISM="Thalassionema frauenfeldii, Strain CCMP 1798" /LENGTH=540 /DNA_ID=CAMNT_0020582573 /DNA_START=213 /DNA_END=1835 /DNA_ORIENTATION=-